MSFLGLLIVLALSLSGLGFLVLLFDGSLYGAKLEELLPMVSLLFVGQPLLLLGREEVGLSDGKWSNNNMTTS